MDDEPFKRLPPISSTTSQDSTSQPQAKYAAERAKLLFGCYRRGDANDPDTYVAAVAMVLAKYPPAIIKSVTDPYSGLPGRKNENGYSGLPDVADVREACEAEAARAERLKRYASMPKALPRIEHRPLGRERANLFVPDSSVKYPALMERHNGLGAESPCEVQNGRLCADQVTRNGLLVPAYWYENARVMPAPRTELPPREQDDIPFDDEEAA